VHDGVDTLHRGIDARAVLDAALGELDPLPRGEELAVRALANKRADAAPTRGRRSADARLTLG